MPVYEYRCDDGHVFEVVQRMVDDPVETCETCGAPVQRVFHPVAVHFKGSGFYTTDYAKKKSVPADSSGSSEGDSSSKDSGSDSSSSKDSSAGDSSSGDSSSSSSSKTEKTTTSGKSGSDSD